MAMPLMCRLAEGSQRPGFRSWICYLDPGPVTIILWKCYFTLFTFEMKLVKIPVTSICLGHYHLVI